MQCDALLSMITASQGAMKRHSRPLSRRVHSAHSTSLEALQQGLALERTPEDRKRTKHLSDQLLPISHFPHSPVKANDPQVVAQEARSHIPVWCSSQFEYGGVTQCRWDTNQMSKKKETVKKSEMAPSFVTQCRLTSRLQNNMHIIILFY